MSGGERSQRADCATSRRKDTRSIFLLPASLSGVLHGCSTAHPRLLHHPSTSLLNATALHRI
ncbi:hypothetical protein KSP40_PGU018749 [Platanthera guangdongensis]|uniref:Uncharacterized protein n=1 Tax=Platanthera guangdongensis TaxID=2320717 RepID=A0ABR2MJJ4_9ASPA